MATTYYATIYPSLGKSNLVGGFMDSGTGGDVTTSFTFATSLLATPHLFVINDEVRLCKIPKGAVITDFLIQMVDVDSATSSELDLGLEDQDPNGLVSASTKGRGAISFPRSTASNPQHFIPSARNFVMRKSVWEQAGGYPEYLTFAGEDTLFALNAKVQASKWAFVPQAIVYWQAPRTLRQLYRTFYRYASGDGEVGTFAHLYWIKVKQLTWGIFGRILGLVLLLAVCVFTGLFVHPLAGWGLASLILLGIVLNFVRKLFKLVKRHHIGNGAALESMLMPAVINLAQPAGFAAAPAARNKP